MDYRKMKGWELAHEYEMAALLDGDGNFAGKADRNAIDKELARRDAMLAALPGMVEALEEAWGLIANANGGDWLAASPEWRRAAEKWRDNRWHPTIAAYRKAEGGAA